MRYFFILLLTVVSSLSGYSQADQLPAVGVSSFKSDPGMTKFSTIVSAKVVEVLTQSQRFMVLDRTNYDKVKEELEFQKTEAFMESENRVTEKAVAAQFMVLGTISKINIFAMKNNDGSINGYKASVVFQLQVTDVASGSNTNAETFQTVTSPLVFSTESAVTEAVKTMLNYAFNSAGFHSIDAIIDPDNLGSEKVLLKNGFRKEAHFIEDEFFEGKFWDSIHYGILKREFIK